MIPLPPASKADCRQRLRQQLNALLPEARRTAAQSLVRQIVALPEWRTAECLLLYYPIEPEPDLRPLWIQALDEGRRVALPWFDARSSSYLAREAPPSPKELVTGNFGLPEPPPAMPVVAWNQLDFILVPGLGFAPDGHRLGRGKGYYDRLLAKTRGFSCGAAYDEQLVASLPVEPHDVRLDCILTPSRSWRRPGATV